MSSDTIGVLLFSVGFSSALSGMIDFLDSRDRRRRSNSEGSSRILFGGVAMLAGLSIMGRW